MPSYFPLTPGQHGEAIRDLQRRLGAAGHSPAPGAEVGVYCPATVAAVAAFQATRGLRSDGICDEHTWTALVEASWKLGDRSLYLTAPNLRGDDVAELQDRLARLGFDCGRVDGILGPRTARALEDFQSNCGLFADAVCGQDTVRALVRVGSQSGTGPGVAVVRERERLRNGWGSIAESRVVLGQFGGLSAITRSLARDLRLLGATVMPLDEPDAVAQAIAANHFTADVYLGFEGSADPVVTVHYYKVPSFESVGGRTLAEAIADALRPLASELAVDVQVVGMRLPVLRETRMPAVLVVLGSVREVVDQSAMVTTAVQQALELWTSRAG